MKDKINIPDTETEPEPNEELDYPRCQIKIADVEVTLRVNDIKLARDTAITLLKNRSVQRYLKSYEIKNGFRKASYID